jgi:amino acid adenylation domain-containing protein
LDVPLERKLGSAFTTSTILKAAWAIVLGRYTGTSDALFGVVQTGRNVPIDGISDIIGPTLTTVPLRIKLDNQIPMTSFLQRIQDQSTKMIRYEQTGLQNIARMGPECRDACAFSSVMVIQPGNQGDVDFLGAHQVHGQDKNFLRFGLGLECTLQNGCVQVTGAYDQRLIAESQMQRILHQFQAAAQQINLETQKSVFDVDLFSSEDWHEMTQMNKDVPNDVFEVTHEVIHRVALDSSDSVAVNAWDIDLVYRELDYLSSVLAHHLRSLGVGPETIVPLCFEKSGWAVVALLGVMKAGGAFVFLDPAYPIARLTEIVNQVEAKVLLSSLSTSSLWKSSGLHVQIVDNVAIELLPSVAGMPETNVTPNSALYVIFTSGSTGKPKGCVIEHHSFLTCAGAQAARANITAGSRILQGASYSFDVSVMEMLTALSVGACICVPNERAKNRSVTEVINDFRITWAFLTPSVAKFMKPADVPCLKTLVLGGEALTTQNIKTWADHVQLINGYGPSECTIAASANSNLTLDTDPANIGKALGGICWIVDPEDHNKLAPMGTIGEVSSAASNCLLISVANDVQLLIEGPIVARGYLNNPEKTAEVFVEDPAWAKKKDGNIRRLYKTGDLAYFGTEGNIMFVGRKDTQVKVRGQRMELGKLTWPALGADSFSSY